MFDFSVVSGTVAQDVIARSRPEIIDAVRKAYRTHGAGRTVNPDSYFLRFPAKPDARIIALPAHLDGDDEVSGIKWISSFPANIDRNIPRASAVLLLNDYATGYPFACLEAAQISAARTAASAVLGASAITGSTTAGRIAVIGAGVIARNVAEFFLAHQWSVGEFVIHDRNPDYADALGAHLQSAVGQRARRVDSLAAAIDGADIVVFATTAGEPYITAADTFAPGQTVLNISLRDLGPEIILNAHNVVDDVEHCLKANTSPHLAEQRYGSRDFIDGTLPQLLAGEFELGADKPRIFSPFGLGVLDLAVGMHVYRTAVAEGRTVEVPGFFGETQRWSALTR
ncbi:2,3-diaminopropionate biosynthesis protein SbnB [Actinokineospora sp.]|uniref:2,3-diaminopropionate biosynthesis protein SbnB n=1 Tax=Actinokineospora sp. TaxID=1872133 RepID=UPI0040382F5C